MLVRREFEWLDRRFRDYDLVYLDPIVCDPALRKSWLSRWFSWRSEDRAAGSFLYRLIQTLELRSEDASPSFFLEKEGLGTRFKSDRIMQRCVAGVVNKHLAEVKARHYTSVASLERDKRSVEKIVDKPRGNSLIIVDAMFSSRAKVPEEIQWTVQCPAQYTDKSIRSVEAILSDSPAPLLTLHDPVIGLMVDNQAFYNWTEAFTTILAARWYPFARTVGLYATSPGGPPFIKVIAILMRPYPSLNEVLSPWPGEPARCSLSGMLEYVLKSALEPEIERLQRLQDEKDKAATTDPGAAVPPFSKIPYERDKQFLSPVRLFQLCCQLNRVSCQGLQAKAPRPYQVLRAYVERLEVLRQCLRDLGIQSQIVSHETDIGRLLPEPLVHEKSGV